jgi:hypothetical protein
MAHSVGMQLSGRVRAECVGAHPCHHTYTHTYACTGSLFTYSHAVTHIQSHTHSYTHTFTLTHALPCSLFSHSVTHTSAHTITHKLTLTCTHTTGAQSHIGCILPWINYNVLKTGSHYIAQTCFKLTILLPQFPK